MNKTKKTAPAIFVTLVLQIIFLSLHSAGTITWSWAAILSPLWISGAVIIIVSRTLAVLKNQ